MDILINGERIELPKIGEAYIDIRIYETGEIVIDGDQDKTAKAIALPEHGDLIDRGLIQEVLAQLLPLVITNELTDKEIGLVHRTVSAIAEMINEQEVVVEATE